MAWYSNTCASPGGPDMMSRCSPLKLQTLPPHIMHSTAHGECMEQDPANRACKGHLYTGHVQCIIGLQRHTPILHADIAAIT